jgi:hypothetical protein
VLAFEQLGHAGIAVVLLAAAPLSRSLRSRVVIACATAGVALSLLLALSGGDDQSWRTTVLTPEAATVAGLTGACAWFLVALLDAGRGRWDHAALVGVSVSGLALFASNRWLVPGLVFWMCVALAVAVGIRAEGGGWAGLTVALSDTAVAGALVASGIDSGKWTMPAPLTGWELYVVLGAAALRAGVVPGFGPFELSRDRAALAPIVIGGSFALLLRVGARAEAWAADATLIVALAVAAWTVAQRLPPRAAVSSWPIALCLGAAFVAPGIVPGAAAAALVIVTLVVLWPLSPQRGRAERGLILTFAPATAGFVVVVGAARAAFAHAVGGEGGFGGGFEWTVASALLPVTLAAGVVVGVRVARQSEPAGFEPAAVVGTWVVFAAAIVLGLAARAVLGISAEVLGPPERVLTLSVAALAAGLAAARVARRMRTPLPAEPRGDAFRMEVTRAWPRAARVASELAPGLLVLAVAATMWLAFEGLREGFLG